MYRKKTALGMVSSIAIATAFATPAMAQNIAFYVPITPNAINVATLNAGTPSLGTPSTTPAVFGEPDADGVIISTADTTTASTTVYTAGAQYTDGNYGGQVVNTSTNLGATVNETTSTTSTVINTPNPNTGALDAGTPSVSAPVVVGDAAVSNVYVGYHSNSTITGMIETNAYSYQNEGETNTAHLRADAGSVSTYGTNYASATGTATFDPATGATTSVIDTIDATSLYSYGLTSVTRDATSTAYTGLGSDGVYVSNSTATSYDESYLTASGLATTGGVHLYTIDPNDRALTAAPYADLTTAGLDTNGTVSAASIITGAIDVNGGVIANVGDGVELTDAVNLGQLTAEATRATNAEDVLTAAVATEATTRADADAALGTRVTNETTRATGAEAVLTTAIATEATTRANADTALGVRVTNETTRATGAEAVLTTAVATEATRATTAEGVLTAAVATEATTRANADIALGTRVTTETTRATGAEAVLTTAVATEATTRATADTALGTAITNAVATAAANLATERSDRTTAETALGTRITNETSARVAADLSLGNRIDTLSARVDTLDKKIDSSTAVAVAMSGSTFLPGVHFNLTANVATYNGAQAGSIQVGYLVSPHVAFNAGVATGFNKGGKTAGRVGVTFGW